MEKIIQLICAIEVYRLTQKAGASKLESLMSCALCAYIYPITIFCLAQVHVYLYLKGEEKC